MELKTRRRLWLVGALLCSGGLYCCAKQVYTRVQAPIDRPAATPTRASGPQARHPIGTNLGPITWSSHAYPFVDVMHQSDPFWSGTRDDWNDGRPLQKDAHGWVTSLASGQVARSFVVGGDDPHHPSGRYVVRHEGKGRLVFRGGVRGEPVESQVDGETRIEVEVQAPDGLWLEIHEIDRSDPMRNIRVYLPGGRCAEDAQKACQADGECTDRCVPFEENADEQPFHPTFLSELAPFGVLRFMDWQRTNRMRGDTDPNWSFWPVREWSGYPGRDVTTWSPTPVDVMVDLANELDADPWFCIPHLASDDFVRQFASRLRERLEPERTVYVEYTNEYWNDIFEQHQVINGLGCARWAEDPRAECDPDGNGVLCEYTEWNDTQIRCLAYGERYFAVRTAEVAAIFDEVFGESARQRVVRVLGMQIGAVGHRGAPMLRQEWRDGEAVHRRIDAVAVAPYFGGGETFENVDDAFRVIGEETHRAPAGTYRLISGGPDAEWGGVYKWIGDDVAALRTEEDLAHIRLVAYEGGQHIVPYETGPRHERYLAINRDPRMKELYLQYLGLWAELTGGSVFVHYNSPSAWSQFGYWGSKEYQGQPRSEAPKHDALLTYIESLQSRR
ncbi:MAG: hypothetical protein H6721_21360 [Sandaracinus sp.]|nr:hypothetical protein [Sandaracinus sp.]